MKIFMNILLFFPLLIYAEITKEDALKFAEQYNLKNLNTNRADVNYAKKFENIANEKIGKKYEYLKSSNIDVDKYKSLEKIDINKKPTNQIKSNSTSSNIKPIEKQTTIKNDKLSTQVNNEDKQEEIIYSDNEEIIYVSESDLKDLEKIANEKENAKEKNEELIYSLKKQSALLESKGIIKQEIEKLEIENKDYEESQLTIFYFVSSDISISNFNDFIAGIDKLKRVGYNIVGRVLFRGLIEDRMDGINDWMTKSEKEYKLKRTSNIKYQFHPWAFRYFSLERVPAFALSTCKKDFRFKTCEHKYLVKGNITFQNFLEILKENNESYNPLFFDLIEVEK